MKKMFSSVAVVCAALMMASCGSGKNAVAVDLSGEWNIVEVNGQQLSGDSDPFIGFDMEGKRIYGNAGCNRMMGAFELDSVNAGKIKLTQMGMTRMMCPDMETERVVTEALNKVAGYTGTEGGVALTDAEGKELVILQKREQKALSLADLAG